MSGMTTPAALTRYFESAEQILVPVGLLTLAHGLGIKPLVVQAILVNKTAEDGFTAGDELFLNPSNQTTGGGMAMIADATNLTIRLSSDAVVERYFHFTTGVPGSPVALGNWRLKLRAWA